MNSLDVTIPLMLVEKCHGAVLAFEIADILVRSLLVHFKLLPPLEGVPTFFTYERSMLLHFFLRKFPGLLHFSLSSSSALLLLQFNRLVPI